MKDRSDDQSHRIVERLLFSAGVRQLHRSAEVRARWPRARPHQVGCQADDQTAEDPGQAEPRPAGRVALEVTAGHRQRHQLVQRGRNRLQPDLPRSAGRQRLVFTGGHTARPPP